ncbi:TlpA family protein disulfide reductase [Pseudoalteromonas denitrificans]|jgi:thiol-disulfide isomerase/thioredoxin|uniref:Thiol-disulfide isomerase or thioredoxin n=1 Tax=Pseudoalteromonas denitrificans DSM 6059 TaxID=1123010 RepID=A0A1I1GT19_9GAMM|nr:TlpA disulfide reductase family protein [Pseudoalteromonas denitrificans]SFC14442.1 Thiol-disulfide isomerase or thioredoxin [Pseudoalteromonas denitrificans DSM 6059]
MKFVTYIFILMGVFSVTTNAQTSVSVGELAPSFKLIKNDGSTFDLKDYINEKPVYLIFWNTWCAHCLKKIPKLISLQNKLASKIAILAINTSWSEDEKGIEDFIKNYKVNYSVAYDHNALVTKKYKVLGTPTEFIIDINGRIIFRDSVPEDISDFIPKWSTIISNSSTHNTE